MPLKIVFVHSGHQAQNGSVCMGHPVGQTPITDRVAIGMTMQVLLWCTLSFLVFRPNDQVTARRRGTVS